MNQRKILNAVKYGILVSGSVLIFLPMILVVMTAFKSNLQIAESWFSLPVPLYLDNFKTLFAKNELKYAFLNSFPVYQYGDIAPDSLRRIPDHGE